MRAAKVLIAAELVLCLAACRDIAGISDYEVVDPGPGGGGAGGGSVGGGGAGGGDVGAGGTGGSMAACEAPGVDEANGTYLFVLSTVLNPSTPLLAVMEVTSEMTEGGLQLFLNGKWLEAANRETPVDPEFGLGPWTLASDGQFVADTRTVFIPAAANAFGVDAEADLEISGHVCKDPTPLAANCGTVSGTTPLLSDLDGSTFKLMRMDDGAIPDPIVIDCAGNVADPL